MSAFKHENIINDEHLQVFFDIARDEQFICPAHWHSHLEVLFVLDGTMTAYVNSQKYELNTFDLLVVNSNDIHSTYIDGAITYILLQIPEEYVMGILPAFPLVRFQEYYPNATTYAPYLHLANVLCTMKEDFEQKARGYELHFTSCLFSFLHDIYKYYSVEISPTENLRSNRDISRIEEVIRYVRLHYRESLSLQEIAQIQCISKEYFCRLFKEYTGQTFLEYVNTLRLARFHMDLTQTSEPITLLLEKHGIQNYKVFMRLFKEAYHMTPSQMRKNRQET